MSGSTSPPISTTPPVFTASARLASTRPERTAITTISTRRFASRPRCGAPGVEAGDRVCISAPKSFSLYAVIFGTLMLNACYVPIDYTVPAGRGRKIVADCMPAALHHHANGTWSG